jgi:hypothetical protein
MHAKVVIFNYCKNNTTSVPNFCLKKLGTQKFQIPLLIVNRLDKISIIIHKLIQDKTFEI